VAAPTCNSKNRKKRFVARGREAFAKQAERSGKRGCGGGSPHLRLKNTEAYTAVAIRESASPKRLAERQRTALQA
jgi:hypothetical protein